MHAKNDSEEKSGEQKCTCFEQKSGSTWEPIAFASRLINNIDSRYSTNELELIVVIWSLEFF